MSILTRQTGAGCLRSWLFAAAFAALNFATTAAQDAPKPDVRNALDNFRGGRLTPAEGKDACEQYAKWYHDKLISQKVRDASDGQGESWLVNDLIKKLALVAHNSPSAVMDYSRHPERLPFVDEFGKAMVAAMEGPAMQSGELIVRVNAARMIAEICRSGYDGAADACIKIIAKPDQNDAVRFYALQGLKNLFAIMPNPTTSSDPGIPEKTVFQKDNTGNLSPLERKSIQALIDYIFRQPTDLKPQDVDGILYVRREAVRALALVRVQRVKDKGAIISQPALALLKIARGDGLNPPSVTPQGSDGRAVGERLEAIIGFCNLIPPRSDRDMNLDYAVYQVGRALQDLTPLYKFHSKETSTPWKVQAMWIRDALTNWRDRSRDNRLENAKLVDDLLNIVVRDILDAIDADREDSLPSPANLDQWLKATMPKSKSLFANDEKTTVNVP